MFSSPEHISSYRYHTSYEINKKGTKICGGYIILALVVYNQPAISLFFAHWFWLRIRYYYTIFLCLVRSKVDIASESMSRGNWKVVLPTTLLCILSIHIRMYLHMGKITMPISHQTTPHYKYIFCRYFSLYFSTVMKMVMVYQFFYV